jgi:hypothetical protein
LKELEAIEAELLQTRSELRRRKLDLSFLQTRIKEGRIKDGSGAERDAEVLALSAKVRHLEDIVQELRRTAGRELPALKMAEEQLAVTRQALDKRRAQATTEATLLKVREAEERIAYLTELEKILHDTAAGLRARLREAGVETTEQRLERLERRVKELGDQLKK